MKKILATLLIFTMVLSSISAFASSPESSYYEETARCVVSGKAEIGNKDVAIVLLNGGNIVYLNQTKTDEYGNYEFRFNYQGAPLTDLRVLQDGNVITDTVSKEKSFVEALTTSLTLGYDEGQDFVSAVVEMQNKYDISGKYTMIFSFYDENNVLVGAPVITEKTFADEINNSAFASSVPQGTKKIKAFVWKDLTDTLMPLTESKEADNKLYEDGTVVGVIGDSITQGIGTNLIYGAALDYIYKTRYLDRDIKFFNKGIAGDASGGAKLRIDYDIFSVAEQQKDSPDAKAVGDTLATTVYGKDPTAITIMLGTNSIGYLNRVFETEPSDQAIALCESATEKLQLLIEAILEKGVTDITVISPFVGVASSQTDNKFPYGLNLAYAEMTRQYKEFVTDYNQTNGTSIKFVDVNAPLMEAQDEGANFGTDLVHTNANGHYIVACEVAKNQGVGSIVAQVNIAGGEAEAINAEITDYTNDGTTISYTYAPKSLPLSTETSYTYTQYNRADAASDFTSQEITISQDLYNHAKQYGYDVESILNNEIIKVQGLDAGNYTVALDGSVAGTYTASQLAEGINIAELGSNPNQVISQQIFAKYGELSKSMAKVRRIYANMGNFGLRCTSLEQAKAVLGGTQARPDNGNYLTSDVVPYDQVVADIQGLLADINTLANARTYEVKIIKQ